MTIPNKVRLICILRHRDPHIHNNDATIIVANKIMEGFIQDSDKVALMSSGPNRATMTIKVFEELLDTKNHVYSILFSEDYYDVRGGRPEIAINAIAEVASKEDADIVIIVTHREWTEHLGRYIKIDRFGESEKYQSEDSMLGYSIARIIDLRNPETEDILITPY